MEQINQPANLPANDTLKKKLVRSIAGVIQELFIMLLVTCLLLILVETLWRESVSSYLNLDHLLIIVIIAGVVSILTYHDEKPVARELPGKKGVIFMIAAGLAGAAIIWYKTYQMGWLSYVISIVSGIVMMLLLTLIWHGDEIEGKDNQGN